MEKMIEERTSDWLNSFKNQTLRPKKVTKKINNTTTISISSGKGGVGKTSLAIKMAQELALCGFRVLLIDGDYNLSNTLVKLNVPLNKNFWDLIKGEKKFNDCLFKRGNFHLLAGCNGDIDLFELKFNYDRLIMDIINEYEHLYHYVIIDSPAGLSKEMLNLNAFCKERIVVLNPDKSSLTDSYSLIKLLKMRYGVRDNFLLINRYRSKMQFERISKTIVSTVKNFLGCECKVIGGIPEYDGKNDTFDRFWLENRTSGSHKIFTKVLKNYYETKKRPSSGHSVNKNKCVV